MSFIIGLFTGPLKKLWGGLAIVLAAAAGLWAYGRSKSREGASKERAKATEKVLENVDKAKRSAGRLDSDPAYRDSVRKRHTRD